MAKKIPLNIVEAFETFRFQVKIDSNYQPEIPKWVIDNPDLGVEPSTSDSDMAMYSLPMLKLVHVIVDGMAFIVPKDEDILVMTHLTKLFLEHGERYKDRIPSDSPAHALIATTKEAYNIMKGPTERIERKLRYQGKPAPVDKLTALFNKSNRG